MKSLPIFLFLLVIGISVQAQTNFQYPKHYKTLSDSNYSVGDTILVTYLFPLTQMKIEPEKCALDLFKFMESNSEFDFVILNHTDARGNLEANQELSQKRAQSIKKDMVELGIPSIKIQIFGKGESSPIFGETEIAAWTKSEKEKAHQMNRRTELVLIKKKN